MLGESPPCVRRESERSTLTVLCVTHHYPAGAAGNLDTVTAASETGFQTGGIRLASFSNITLTSLTKLTDECCIHRGTVVKAGPGWLACTACGMVQATDCEAPLENSERLVTCCAHTEPFSSSRFAGLKDVYGLGQIRPDPPGAMVRILRQFRPLQRLKLTKDARAPDASAQRDGRGAARASRGARRRSAMRCGYTPDLITAYGQGSRDQDEKRSVPTDCCPMAWGRSADRGWSGACGNSEVRRCTLTVLSKTTISCARPIVPRISRRRRPRPLPTVVAAAMRAHLLFAQAVGEDDLDDRLDCVLAGLVALQLTGERNPADRLRSGLGYPL